MAEIDYGAVDGASGKGIILFVKPSYHGCEGAGVMSYAKANPRFPHESTADQWFGEAQFESYRALGFEIMDSILAGAYAKIPKSDAIDLADIFTVLLDRVSRRTEGLKGA